MGKSIKEKLKYSQYFSEASLWKKIKKFSKSAGISVIYSVLLLYYIMKDGNIDIKTKLSIAAALGYFILPTDAILDLSPIIGYTDDFGVLIFALTQVSSHLTPSIKIKARNKLSEWFGKIKEKDINDLESKII